MLKKRSDKPRVRGDTLVEVLFATATAALLIVITLVLMNRNLAQIQLGVEVTFARQAIDSQAEVLRYIRDQYMDNRSAELNADTTPTVSKLWKDMVDPSRADNYAQAVATDFGTCQPSLVSGSSTITAPASGKAFFINSNSSEAEGDAASVQDLDATHANNLLNKTLGLSETYARPGQGIWIEAVNPSFAASQSNRYVDFHIRACWEPPFSTDKATLGTIVRLYYETPTGGTPLAFIPICSDTFDNDSDGKIDFNGAGPIPPDPDCTGPNDTNEAPDPPPAGPPPPALVVPLYTLWYNFSVRNEYFYTVRADELAAGADLIIGPPYPGYTEYTPNSPVGYIYNPARPAAAAVAGAMPLYRLWCAGDQNSHQYTTDPGVVAAAVAAPIGRKCTDQGTVGYVLPFTQVNPTTRTCAKGSPVYELFYQDVAPRLVETSYYTMNQSEYNTLPFFGYIARGVAWCMYSDPSQAPPAGVIGINPSAELGKESKRLAKGFDSSVFNLRNRL